MAFYVLGQQLIEKASFRGLCEAVVEHAGRFVSQEQGSPLYGGDDVLPTCSSPRRSWWGSKDTLQGYWASAGQRAMPGPLRGGFPFLKE